MSKNSDENSKKESNFFNDWIVPLILALILAFILRTFIFQTTKVDGLSMYPTLDNGDMLIASQIPYYFDEPHRGDIILFKSPMNENEIFIKRVIGQEGDDVRIVEGEFYINGKKLEEDYLAYDVKTHPVYGGQESWKVEEGQVFAVGDNRGNSTDSRIFGPIDEDSVVGRAVFRFWPLNKIGVLE